LLAAMTRTRSSAILIAVRSVARNRRPLLLLSVVAVLAVAAAGRGIRPTPGGSDPISHAGHPAT
jgi:hypothetical protein